MTPARQRYLMQAVSAHAPVYFLDLPHFNGSYVETRRPRAERIADNLTVVHDAFGVRQARGFKRLGRVAAAVDSAWLHELLRARGVRQYIYWVSVASPRMLWSMRTDRLVYDSIDPCFVPEEQAQFDREEFAFAKLAKVVFCTAQSIHDRLRTASEHCYLLPNACSAEEYDPTVLRQLPRPAALAGRPGKFVGYMGTFDSRVDIDLLIHAARQLPELTFALAGRINQEQMQRVAPLRALPNVIMPGSVSVEEGRAFVAAFDVGLIPFVPGPISDAINPVKMFMYLMAGKPVVSSWIQECRGREPLVLSAKSADDFVSAIKTALVSDPTAATARTEFARRNTWAVRAAEAMRILDQRGLLASEPSTRVAS
jgi:glycosyltransferase involved in cell wall biosynthesis